MANLRSEGFHKISLAVPPVVPVQPPPDLRAAGAAVLNVPRRVYAVAGKAIFFPTGSAGDSIGDFFFLLSGFTSVRRSGTIGEDEAHRL